jgi:hypothetical protein
MYYYFKVDVGSEETCLMKECIAAKYAEAMRAGVFGAMDGCGERAI